MQPINTLDDFFTRSGADVTLYHMGRRVTPCPRDTLVDFENGRAPWPEPWQGQARLAAVFRLGDMPDPAIWFLSLPLDEQGFLSPAQRDAFVQRLLETLGQSAQQTGDADARAVEHLMHDNPLAFTPETTFQAVLNARATQDTGRPPSQYMAGVNAFIAGRHQDWESLGLQGLADYAMRADASHQQALAKALDTLPIQVLRMLCHCLEHRPLVPELVGALCQRGETAAGQGDVETFCACIRAVGSSRDDQARVWYATLLADPAACGPDTLAAMAGRGWPLLEDGERLPLFLSRLAEEPRSGFGAAVRDLALIPRLRLPIIALLRDAPQGSPLQARLRELTGKA
ncbi:DUF3549 family protein [Halomonas cibimaris]|uniref:DUF3549 family protein n=1 Tax=Halomonas cibimaris TaxID=657012 RepID=A0ABP7LSX2_9GAMM